MKLAFAFGVLGAALISGLACADTPAARAEGSCGAEARLACDAGQWCDPEPGRCGDADLPGTCVAVPEVCIDLYQPVCGCDGRTYANDCRRKAARVQKDRDGECESAER